MSKSGGFIERLNSFFGRFGGWSYDYRHWVLALSVLTLGAGIWLASTVRFDSSMEAFFDTSDPTYQAYRAYRADFGSDELAYILYEAPDSEHGVFDIEVMRQITALTERIEKEVPFVRDVTNLTNIEYLEGVDGGIEVYDLLEDFPEDQSGFVEVRRKALAKELYIDAIVSGDGERGAIIVDMERSAVDHIDLQRWDPEGGDGLANLYPQVSQNVLEEVLAGPEFEGLKFYNIGDVRLNSTYNVKSSTESSYLGMISVAVIAVMLGLFFRRPVGVVGPLAVVVLSIFMSLGLIGLLGWTLDLMFVMVPTLLIAVGVADGVHLVSEFQAFQTETSNRREAMVETLAHVGAPCLFTSLTTAAGFLSMTVAPIESISHLAVYSAFGVMAAFFLSITLLFVFLAMSPEPKGREDVEDTLARAKGGRRFKAFLDQLTDFVVGYTTPILVIGALLFAFSIAGIAQLKVDSNLLNELSPKEPVRIDTEYVDKMMSGALSVVYVFDSGEPDGIYEPEFLREVDRVAKRALEHGEVVSKTYSIVEILKDLNRAFHGGDQAYYRIPETRDLVAQYMLIYELSGGEEVSEYVTGDFQSVNLELRCRSVPVSQMAAMVEDVRQMLEEQPLEYSSVELTGVGALWLRLMDYITYSQIRGFSIAFFVIAMFLCVIFQSVKVGLVAMIPNLSPVFLTLGVMGWMDIPLDYVRLLIGSVAIGISVDDSIHSVNRFVIEFRRLGNYEAALRATMQNVGRALIITSVVLIVGFLVYYVSTLDSMVMFGMLLAGTVLIALVADLLLLPAMILRLQVFGPESNPTTVEAD
jgi:predicted RND superfamily exporter protein